MARLTALIKDAGLSGQKAPRIQEILRRVKSDVGQTSLSWLRDLPDARVETYLTSLPGVGTKTAKCVMLFSLGRQVLPVDTHVWRVSRRIGLVAEDEPLARADEALEAVVPGPDRLSLHVNGLIHGQRTCRPVAPRCSTCPVRRLCDYYRAGALERP